MLHVTLLASRILRWLLEFRKICGPLPKNDDDDDDDDYDDDDDDELYIFISGSTQRFYVLYN